MLRARREPRLPETLRRSLTFWRRSMEARVAVSTLLLSALVISLVGWFLLHQTRDGLLQQRVDAVVAETAGEIRDSQTRLDAVPGTDTAAAAQQRDLVDPIIQRGVSRGFGVVLGGPVGQPAGRITDGGAEFTPGLDTASVPSALEERFDEVADPAWTYTDITTDGSVTTEALAGAGVVVGSQVTLPADGRTYTVYLLYPLGDEQNTLALVTRAMLTAGVLLLVLMVALTWVVTRQVVTPIRLARQVAERLASGHLEERLKVTGEDDMARLATSFNQMAANLQRQIWQLEELSRMQRRFVSDVSHELRTPLTTVRMAGDILHEARADFDPVTSRAAELLQKELDRFETLLTDLLEISRFDAGAAVLDIDAVNLVDVAHRVADSTRPLAAQRNVRIVVRAAAHPCLADADERRVERIVRNLLTNAIDHARTDDDLSREVDVVVLVDADNDASVIAVRDYGVGLAKGQTASVFERFWRADPARARTSGGTGLGLSIALEDARLHGGWLQAWGRPGQGSQFRLTLPRHTGEALRASPLPLAPRDVVEPVV
ncbi:MAG: sensor histidine kinase [Nocardioides sp.]|nr:sensor histidine kinase [Nocardioides sp.]